MKTVSVFDIKWFRASIVKFKLWGAIVIMWQVQFHIQLYFLLLEERFPKLIISIGNRTEWSTIQGEIG